MRRGYSVVWGRWYLSAVGVRVGVRHMRGHVTVVLVIMRACPTTLLVHVWVVCVWRRHRVEMVGAVVSRGSLSRTRGAIG